MEDSDSHAEDAGYLQDAPVAVNGELRSRVRRWVLKLMKIASVSGPNPHFFVTSREMWTERKLMRACNLALEVVGRSEIGKVLAVE